MDESPYFSEHFPRDASVDSELRFERNIQVIPGSTGSTIKGLNVLICVLDEANFWKQGGGAPGNIEKVRRIYEDVTARPRTRFLAEEFDSGFSIVITSATHAQSFIEQRKQTTEARCLHTTARAYQVKPNDYSEHYFVMFRGTESEPPHIVETPEEFQSMIGELNDGAAVSDTLLEEIVSEGTTDRLEGSSVPDLLDQLPESVSEWFLVPTVDFKEDYQTDPYEALKDIGGVPVEAANKLFTHRKHWERCEQDWDLPFTQGEIVLSTESDRVLEDDFQPMVLCERGTRTTMMSFHIIPSGTRPPRGLYTSICPQPRIPPGLPCAMSPMFEPTRMGRGSDPFWSLI